MSVICKSCGGKTVPEASNWSEDQKSKPRGVVSKCYAKLEDGKWVSGCGVKMPPDKKIFADCLIKDQNLRKYKA
jgi:hypothetical protein